MAILFANDAGSALSASITISATEITIPAPDAGLFPNPTSGDYFMVTVADELGNMEIMKCTARSGGTLTVQRAQEGTTAVAFNAGAVVDLRLTRGTMEAMSQNGHGHTAAQVSFTNTGTAIAASNTQDALEELDADLTAGLAALDALIDALTAVVAGKLSLTGGELTGGLTIRANNPLFHMNKLASGQQALIRSFTNGALRWVLDMASDEAEAGAATGSNWRLFSVDDDGMTHRLRIKVLRDSGYTNVFSTLEVGSPNAGHSVLIRRHVDGANVGGMLQLECAPGSLIAGNLQARQSGDGLQLLEAGGSQRGVNLQITECAAGAGSALIHTGNLRGNLAAGDTQDIGKYIFALHAGAPINFGQLVAGGDLRASSHVGFVGTTITVGGTWRCCGQASGANQATVYQRVA